MARSSTPKTIECYRCNHRFEVSSRTQSTSCPGCNKSVMVADQVIAKPHGPLRELKTCGKIIVKKKARLICHHIVAHNGIDCLGIIDAREVASAQAVKLGPKSRFKGDLTAPSLEIAEGARIDPSRFAIGPKETEKNEDPESG